MKLETLNCVNYLIWNPKHSAKYVYHTGTSASSIARAGTSYATERRRTRNLSSTPWISSRFRITSRGSQVLHREFAQEEMQEETFLGYPRPVHSRREIPQEICLTSVALENCVVEWINWRTKTTRTTSLQKKLVCTATIGGSVRTQLVPIRCQSGIELTSSKHCQPCDSSNTNKMQLISNDGKVIPHLGGTGKNPGSILLMSITTKTDPALIDQGNLLKSDWDTYSRYDSQNSLGASLQFENSVTAYAVYCHRRVV